MEGRKDNIKVFMNLLWVIDMWSLKQFLYFYVFCEGCLFSSNVWFWANGAFQQMYFSLEPQQQGSRVDDAAILFYQRR